MKIFSCARCGAPLKARWWRGRQKCNYCGAENVVEKAKTLHEEKPKNFEQPKEWKPPPDAQADSSETLKYKSDPGIWIFYLVITLVILFGGALGLAGVWWPHFYGIVPTDLQKLDVVQSPEKIAGSLQGADHDQHDFVRAKFRTSAVAENFYQTTFQWDGAHLDAPKEIIIESFDGSAGAGACERLSSHLQGGLADGNWSYGPFVHFACARSHDHTTIDLTVVPADSDAPNPDFHRQLQFGYKLLLNAAFGLPVTVDPNEARALFGAGYPIGDLGKINPATSVRDAATVIKNIFPGALVESSDGSTFEIALDHPLVVAAHLQWYNAAPLRVSRLGFDLAPGFPKKVDPFIACLAPHFGKPNEVFTDFAKNEKRVEFQLGGTEHHKIELDFDTRDAHADAELGFPPEVWSTIFKTIDGCR